MEIDENTGASPHHHLEDLEVVGEAVEDALEVVERPRCRPGRPPVEEDWHS